MTGTTLRAATAADIDAIDAIERVSFSDPWRRDGFRDLILNDAARVTVAVADGVVVGYTVTQAAADEGEVLNLAVAPWARRAGVGRALLDGVVASARAAGVAHLYLDVREANVAARALYGGAGFVEVARRRGYYDRPREDAIVLRLALGATR